MITALDQHAPAAPDLTVVVRGHRPAPQGSKRHIGRGRMVEQSKRVAPWRVAVKAAVEDALVDAQTDSEAWVDSEMIPGLIEAKPIEPLDGPLSVEVVFTVRKPASSPKRRLTWPTTRDSGDLDKLLRSTFDALTDGGAIADDSRVVEVVARKVHPLEGLDALPEPGAVIRIWRLPTHTTSPKEEAA